MKTLRMAGLAGLLAGVIAVAGEANAHPQGKAHSQGGISFVADAKGWVRRGELIQTGTASYYGIGPLSRYTASGEVFDRSAMTAAHPWLPFGTRVLVRDEH